MLVVMIPLMIAAGIFTHITARHSVARQTAVQGDNPQTAIMNKLMLYVFPIGVVVGAPFLPLAVLLYWVANNLWTLGQQYVVYKRIDREQTEKREIIRGQPAVARPEAGAEAGASPEPVVVEPTEKISGPKPVTRKPASNGTRNGSASNGFEATARQAPGCAAAAVPTRPRASPASAADPTIHCGRPRRRPPLGAWRAPHHRRERRRTVPKTAQEDATEVVAGSRPATTAEDQLVREGDIAGDYLERLLDVLDYDGDIDLDVEAGRAIVSIDGGEDLEKLVGDRGAVLEALQELTRLAVQQASGNRSRLMLDIAGWRQGRRDELTELGLRTAKEVLESGEPARMRPMTPFERKVVPRCGCTCEGCLQRERGRGAAPPGRRVPRCLIPSRSSSGTACTWPVGSRSTSPPLVSNEG